MQTTKLNHAVSQVFKDLTAALIMLVYKRNSNFTTIQEHSHSSESFPGNHHIVWLVVHIRY